MRPPVSRQLATRPRRRPLAYSAWLLPFMCGLFTSTAAAQELTPRLYWPAPNGTQTLMVGFGHQWGDVLTDSTLPITSVNSRINHLAVGYQQTLGWFGRTTNLQVELPFVDATTLGLTEGLPALRDVRGLGDLSTTLSVNLLGAPSMDAEEFHAFRVQPRPILAATLKVVAPTGQYDEDRLFNIGANRWATRLRFGYLQPLAKKWVLESAVGTWFFQDNPNFLGQVRGQDPITAVDLSLVHRFRPGFWLSLDGNFYIGGRTNVGDDSTQDLQRNVRVGATLVYPFHRRRYALRAIYTHGVVTRSGEDFNGIGLSLVFLLN